MNINTPSTTTAGNLWTFTTSKKQPEQGWECPRCGAINAPWVRQCDCNDKSWKITCDDTIENEWWKEYVTSDTDTFRIHPEKMATYTTAHNSTTGGSDYWDDFTKTWSNIDINISNNKKEK